MHESYIKRWFTVNYRPMQSKAKPTIKANEQSL